MKLISVLIIICALFAGCGPTPDESFITVHHMDTLEELWSHAPEDVWGIIAGRTNCESVLETNYCDIYVMYPEWYGPEYCYNEILGHETRHAFEGTFHAKGVSSKSLECGLITGGKVGEYHYNNN